MVNVLEGEERFRNGDEDLPFSVLEFWRWASSDLLGNALRGVLAEFLVARALECVIRPRVEWDATDLCMARGLRVEVKASGYLQSWTQMKPSRPSFTIGPKRSWHADTNEYESVASRPADLYVFALHAHRERASADPIDLSQWEFYVVPTAILNERCSAQKQIGLARVRELSGGPVQYRQLREAVERIEATRANKALEPAAPGDTRRRGGSAPMR